MCLEAGVTHKKALVHARVGDRNFKEILVVPFWGEHLSSHTPLKQKECPRCGTLQNVSIKNLETRLNKKMGCKACGEAQYRSNLSVVRIWASRVTQQTAFYLSSLPIQNILEVILLRIREVCFRCLVVGRSDVVRDVVVVVLRCA